jgi:hypothetical protein
LKTLAVGIDRSAFRVTSSPVVRFIAARATSPPAWATMVSSARSSCARVPIRFVCTVTFAPFPT